MQNKPGWFTGWCAGILALVACGGDTEPAGPDPTESQVEIQTDEPAKVLLVFAVHGLQRGDIDGDIAPNLARLQSEGARFPGHAIQSTGSQSQMATLFTGRSPLQHGVGSIHENGLSALAEDEQTMAEFLGEQGFVTMASMALPQFSPEISGLHQGFDTYLGPNVLGDSLRRCDRVEMVVRGDFKSGLASGKPVFAWMQSADALRPGLEPSANIMKFAKVRLESMLPKNPGLMQSIQLVDSSPGEFEEVRRAVLRARGSEVHKQFMAGIYEGQLADLDEAVGRCLAALEDSGRTGEAAIALVGTQGAQPVSKSDMGNAAFPSDVIRAPLFLWSPGRVPRGQDSRVLSSQYVPDLLCDLLGLQFGDQNPWEPVVTLWDAGLSRRAMVGANFHLEENAAAGWLGFDDRGTAITQSKGLDESQRIQWQALQAAAALPPVRFGYELNFDCKDPVTVRWRMVEGRFRGATLHPESSGELGRIAPLTGSATLSGQGVLRVETFAREAPVVWSLEGLGTEGEPANQALLQVVKAPYGAELDAGRSKGPVEVHRDAGIWTRVLVQGEAGRPVTIHAGLLPKKQNATRRPIKMEWTVGFEDTVERLAGREDAILLSSKTPLNVQFKEVPGHTLSLSVQVQGQWLPQSEMSYEGKSLAPSGQRTVFTPSWWPGVTEALFEDSGMRLGPGLSLRRFGPVPKVHKALSPDSSFFVGRLGRAE
ncbi:MAG: sulfatase-like hydrolase/transferase [Planctomycetota bacterium]|nr:sulfatase-like hydrolase/transferase [Planctomycetota bacterium]